MSRHDNNSSTTCLPDRDYYQEDDDDDEEQDEQPRRATPSSKSRFKDFSKGDSSASSPRRRRRSQKSEPGTGTTSHVPVEEGDGHLFTKKSPPSRKSHLDSRSSSSNGRGNRKRNSTGGTGVTKRTDTATGTFGKRRTSSTTITASSYPDPDDVIEISSSTTTDASSSRSKRSGSTGYPTDEVGFAMEEMDQRGVSPAFASSSTLSFSAIIEPEPIEVLDGYNDPKNVVSVTRNFPQMRTQTISSPSDKGRKETPYPATLPRRSNTTSTGRELNTFKSSNASRSQTDVHRRHGSGAKESSSSARTSKSFTRTNLITDLDDVGGSKSQAENITSNRSLSSTDDSERLSIESLDGVFHEVETVISSLNCCAAVSPSYEAGIVPRRTTSSTSAPEDLIRRGGDVLAKAAVLISKGDDDDGDDDGSFGNVEQASPNSVFGGIAGSRTRKVKKSKRKGAKSSSPSKRKINRKQGKGGPWTNDKGKDQKHNAEYSSSLFDVDLEAGDQEHISTLPGSDHSSNRRNRHILKRLKANLADRVRAQLQKHESMDCSSDSSSSSDKDRSETGHSETGHSSSDNNSDDKDEADSRKNPFLKHSCFWGYSSYVWGTVCCCLVLFIGSIVLAIALALSSSGSSLFTTNQTIPEELLSTSSPTVKSQRMESLIDLIGPIVAASPQTMFNDPWSPQFRSMSWLANDDPASIPVEEEAEFRLVERYAIMVLYFTNGIDAPDLNLKYHFQNSSWVCAWHDIEASRGISCEGSYVTEIVLRK